MSENEGCVTPLRVTFVPLFLSALRLLFFSLA